LTLAHERLGKAKIIRGGSEYRREKKKKTTDKKERNLTFKSLGKRENGRGRKPRRNILKEKKRSHLLWGKIFFRTLNTLIKKGVPDKIPR